MLVAANPGNITMHIVVSVFVSFVVTFFVLYQRAVDTKDKKTQRELGEIFWMFKSV
jgi:hypothetical protein